MTDPWVLTETDPDLMAMHDSIDEYLERENCDCPGTCYCDMKENGMNLYLGVDVRGVSREQAADIKRLVGEAVRAVTGAYPEDLKDTLSEVKQNDPDD